MLDIQILSLIGVPAISAAIIFKAAKSIVSCVKDMRCMQLGLQALLRERLYEYHDKWMEKGYAPKWAKENFENMYKQYHNLGENGVMDSYYEAFMQLPDKLATN